MDSGNGVQFHVNFNNIEDPAARETLPPGRTCGEALAVAVHGQPYGPTSRQKAISSKAGLRPLGGVTCIIHGLRTRLGKEKTTPLPVTTEPIRFSLAELLRYP